MRLTGKGSWSMVLRAWASTARTRMCPRRVHAGTGLPARRRCRGAVPLIVKKSDGGYGYAATDLMAIRDRVFNPKANTHVYA
ncbi:arginine--tRNA ligase [Streptomyces olivochromogenes]|uniref:Arginine--tRNA ligase n=1 Tax=Streptomyces olivochromogenes TaxID=1963 RepID=A0A250VUS1_STROL|nr:arginine--tRNA ligase [Streptomyces olivochromogenes]